MSHANKIVNLIKKYTKCGLRVHCTCLLGHPEGRLLQQVWRKESCLYVCRSGLVNV